MPYFRRTSKSSQGPGKNQPVYGMKYPGLGLTIGSRVNFRGAIFDRAMIPLNDNTPVDESLPTLQAVLSKMTLNDGANQILENFIIVFDLKQVYATQDISFELIPGVPLSRVDLSMGINDTFLDDATIKAALANTETGYGRPLYKNSLTDKDFNNATNPQNLNAVRLPYIDAEYYTVNIVDSSWNIKYYNEEEAVDFSANILSGDISGNTLVGVPDADGAMIQFPVSSDISGVSRGILGNRVVDDNGDGILAFDVKGIS